MKDDDFHPSLTVRELIALLNGIPEEHKDFYVGCSYDTDCAWTYIHGLKDSFTQHERWEPVPTSWVRLQGD